MKILLLSGSSYTTYGGFERVASSVSKALIKRGYNVELLSIVAKKSELEKDAEYVKGIKIQRYLLKYRMRIMVPKIFFYSLLGKTYTPGYNQIRDYLKNNDKPDIVIVTNVEWIFTFALKKVLKDLKFDDVKIVWWHHTSLYPKLPIWMRILGSNFMLRIIFKKLVKEFDAFLAISTGIKEQILKFAPSAKIYTVFNPLNPYNGGLILRSKKTIFLYVGRIDDNPKNISFMFKGLSKIKKDWKLIIVGTGPDENKLKSLANDLMIFQKIEWKGFKADPYKDLNEGVTSLLFTSRYEGFPMVLVEANQRGIPVISSNCQTGPSDIVISGVNGYLYPEGDMDAFVKTVNDAMDGKLTFGTPEEIAKTSERFYENEYMERFIDFLNKINTK